MVRQARERMFAVSPPVRCTGRRNWYHRPCHPAPWCRAEDRQAASRPADSPRPGPGSGPGHPPCPCRPGRGGSWLSVRRGSGLSGVAARRDEPRSRACALARQRSPACAGEPRHRPLLEGVHDPGPGAVPALRCVIAVHAWAVSQFDNHGGGSKIVPAGMGQPVPRAAPGLRDRLPLVSGCAPRPHRDGRAARYSRRAGCGRS